MSTPRPLGLQVALVTAGLISVAGAVGFVAGGILWLLVVVCGGWAVFQATGELAGGPLRMTAAMSALCVLLTSIGGRASVSGALDEGILIAVGALWAIALDQVRHRSLGAGDAGTRSLELTRLTETWPAAGGYSALLSGTAMLAVGVVGPIRISHGA